MSGVGGTGLQPNVSWISSYRAKRAMAAIESRGDSFRMNEFGDVGIVDFNTLRAIDKDIRGEDVADLLGSLEIKVYVPAGRQLNPKPHKIKLGVMEGIFAKVAKFFNARTTGRANRLQDEMELQFGRFAGKAVNFEIRRENGDKVDAAESRNTINMELSKFIRNVESFVDLYELNAGNRDAVEDFTKNFVRRFVNSVRNDTQSLKRLYGVASGWTRPEVQDRSAMVMDALCREIEAVVGKPDTGPEKVSRTRNDTGFSDAVRKEKDFLKLSFSKKLKDLRELCAKAGGEMREFENAFEIIAKRLDENPDGVKSLSGGVFRQVIEDMAATMREVIAKGRSAVEQARGRDRVKELMDELDRGYGDISRVDVEKTNKYVGALLTSNWKTAEKVRSEMAMQFMAEESLEDIVAARNDDYSKVKTSSDIVNMLNDVIGKFSAAQNELMHSVRERVERYELTELLSKRENLPPAGVDGEKWREACRLVGEYLVNGGRTAPEGLLNEHVSLLKVNEAYFTADLPALARERIGNIFNVYEVSLGFMRQAEVESISLDGASFEACEKESAVLYESLMSSLKLFAAGGGEIDPLAAKVSALVCKALESRKFDLEKKVEIGVADTLENRQTGIMFRNGNGELCRIADEDLETLFGCLAKSLSSAGAMLANTLAVDVAASRRDHDTCRNEAIARLMAGMEPVVEAMRTVRGLIVCNALARIREGMVYIRDCRPGTQSEVSWNVMCAKAQKAMSEMQGMDVTLVLEELKPLLEAIQNDVAADGMDPSGAHMAKNLELLERNFSSDVGLLEMYGERGIQPGMGALRSAVKVMDHLTVAFKRTADIQDLVFNSLEALPDCLAGLDALQKSDALKSGWFNPNTANLSIAADKLRTDLSAFTRKVLAYVTVLREDGVWNVGSKRRQEAVAGIKDALNACVSSFVPVIGMLSDTEVYVREQFAANDGGNVKKTPAICLDAGFAKTFTSLHTAIRNAFCSLSEIPRGVLLAMSDSAVEDGLPLLHMEQVPGGIDNESAMAVIGRRRTERKSIQYKGYDAFDYHGGDSGTEVGKVRAIYRDGQESESAGMRMTMVGRGSKSADLFTALENVSLAIAAAKQRGKMSPDVIRALEELVEGRVRIHDDEELRSYVRAKAPKASAADIARLDDGGDAGNLVMNIISLSSKFETYGIEVKGTGRSENHARKISDYLRISGIRNYTVASVGDNQGNVDRVVVRDSSGNQAFYTVKYEARKVFFGVNGLIRFTPEPGASKSFKAFEVPEYHPNGDTPIRFPLVIAGEGPKVL